MTDSELDLEQQEFSENDYCPICGLLVRGVKKHVCPEHVLDEICREEEAKSEEFDDDSEKSYGERLDDAEFILNYYDDEYDNDDDDDDDDDIF
jgi:hypothetical protein